MLINTVLEEETAFAIQKRRENPSSIKLPVLLTACMENKLLKKNLSCLLDKRHLLVGQKFKHCSHEDVVPSSIRLAQNILCIRQKAQIKSPWH